MAIEWPKTCVWVTGGEGFLGQAVCRALRERDCREVASPSKEVVDLVDFDDTLGEMEYTRPDVVFHLAAEVGGIGFNVRQPGRLFYANMAMGLNTIEAARRVGVGRFVQVGTACSYPRDIALPFLPKELWQGYPEKTNAPYGVAKRALICMLDAYRQQYGFNGVCAILANLYGPGDHFHLENSHVIPALIRKFSDAQEHGAESVTCWGTGCVNREFLYVEDAAEALIRVAEWAGESVPINIGTGQEISIRNLAHKIAAIVGFEGEIKWDASKPDGRPHSRLATHRTDELLGWRPQTCLDAGLQHTIAWWREQHA